MFFHPRSLQRALETLFTNSLRSFVIRKARILYFMIQWCYKWMAHALCSSSKWPLLVFACTGGPALSLHIVFLTLFFCKGPSMSIAIEWNGWLVGRSFSCGLNVLFARLCGNLRQYVTTIYTSLAQEANFL